MKGHDPYKPSIDLEGISVNVTPEQIAEAFWSLDSSSMCQFFQHLDEKAKGMLGFQIAFVVIEMEKRSADFDYRAQNAFRTMFDHASNLQESFNDIRCDRAKAHISNMVLDAKRFRPG